MSKNRNVSSKTAGNKRSGPVILIAVGVVIILVVVVWQLSRLPATTAAQSSTNFDIPYPEMKRVSLSDSKQAFDEDKAVFLDVRDSGTYGSKHIKGAINIPLNELETRFTELPKDRWIITVCT
jgi:cytochrome oxidase assembly protein ShyY1